VAVDSSGNVYFAELTTYRVRKVSIGGILSTAAGCDLTTIACILAGYGDGGPAIAPNTWVEIKGTNLAPAGDTRIWAGADFVNNQMPT
jgi:hypothetical protein